ncbi:MBL fold metallo-hydrolase [Bacillota bacterium]
MDLKITFWGVRGSKPSPGKHTTAFGGNTSCVQIQAGSRNLIFDGGTGIAELGHRMIEEGATEADIFFSHLHWDHIHGLPFFHPFFRSGNRFRLYGLQGKDYSLESALKGQMKPPYFPISMDNMKSSMEFIHLDPSSEIDLGEGLRIRMFEVDHPNTCLSFRVECGNSAAVYCTDTETLKGLQRDDFIKFIKGADALIYDSHFTEAEYEAIPPDENGRKWGHSTWEEGTKLAAEGGVGYLFLFHHKDSRRDEDQTRIEQSAKQLFRNTLAAREGMAVEIGGDYPEKVVLDYPR